MHARSYGPSCPKCPNRTDGNMLGHPTSPTDPTVFPIPSVPTGQMGTCWDVPLVPLMHARSYGPSCPKCPTGQMGKCWDVLLVPLMHARSYGPSCPKCPNRTGGNMLGHPISLTDICWDLMVLPVPSVLTGQMGTSH